MPDKKHILVVEDDEQLLNVLTTKLHSQGFDVYKAQDGYLGLEVALNRKPDLILLDVLMPRMSGLATLKSLRSDPWGQTVPVIVLTNVPLEDESLINSISEYKPSYCLQKTSVTLEEIVEKIHELVSSK